MRRLREAVTRTWSWTIFARKGKLAGFALLLNCKLIGKNVFLVLYNSAALENVTPTG